MWTAWLELCPLVYFLLQGVFRHLWWFLFLDSQLCPFRRISRDLLLYWGLHPIIPSLTFSEGYPKLLEELAGYFSATWYGGIHTNNIGGIWSYLQISLSIWPLFSGGVLGGSFLSLGYLLKWTPESLDGLIRDGKWCPWKYSTYLMVSLSLEK